MSSAAYFDVDGTLVGTNLIHPTVWFLANQASPLKSARRIGQALLNGPQMALAELRDRRLFNELLFHNFRGMTEDRMHVLAEEAYDKTVAPRIFPGTRDLIQKCKDAGLRVVLITGSLDFTIRPLARELGVNPDDILTNRLEFKDGIATGKLLRPVVAGPTKARLMVADAKKHGHDLSTSHAYSDSYSDVPMLSVVGHPHCINPDPKLRRLAVAYDWPVLDIETPSRVDIIRD
ncbi:MAG: HAD family hydrolase [Myxococcota bacterium]|nr:HAD family hydrolase [Myxococcota bacterium]